jgi:hypothetical protein
MTDVVRVVLRSFPGRKMAAGLVLKSDLDLKGASPPVPAVEGELRRDPRVT